VGAEGGHGPSFGGGALVTPIQAFLSNLVPPAYDKATSTRPQRPSTALGNLKNALEGSSWAISFRVELVTQFS
jgi:hypothetical protein